MLWDLNEGKHLYTLDSGDNINALCFSPNRYWLCAATGPSIKIWVRLRLPQNTSALMMPLVGQKDRLGFVCIGDDGTFQCRLYSHDDKEAVSELC